MFNICVRCFKFRQNFLRVENNVIQTISHGVFSSKRSINTGCFTSYNFVYNVTKPNLCYGTRYFSNDVTNVILKANDTNSNVRVEDNSETTTESLYKGIDYEEITGGDPEKNDSFQLLLLEVEVLRQDGMRVPKVLTTDQWKELFNLETRSQRRKYLAFLWLTEIKKISDKRRKERKKIAALELKEEKDSENEGHIRYGFNGSTIFLRIYDAAINMYDNNKLIQAMQFGQDMIIDCSYENDMNTMENKMCAKQFLLLFVANRMNKEPFNLHFCNFNKEGKLYKTFDKFLGHQLDSDPYFPVNIHEEHYLKLFPKEKLVYLTPHCRTELREFSHDDIYIIGGMVDRVNQDHLSLAKAKSEGLRMAQLPLDRYLDWHLGSKSLTLNQMMAIMLDIRTTGDWNSALKHIPKRKLRRPDDRSDDMKKLSKRYIGEQRIKRHLRPLWGFDGPF